MQAVLMSGYGTPDLLNVSEVGLPEPGDGQIRLAGVGPTDLAIRSGHLRNVFPMGDPAILGGAGAVGTIATQLAVAAGVTVISAVRERDFAATGQLGATPIDYARPLGDSVTAVDAVFDAAGRSDLETAVRLAGGPERVITLSDPRGPQIGVTLSSSVPGGIRSALNEVMTRLGEQRLTLRPHAIRPLAEAAAVHAGLESGALHTKVLLATSET